MPPVSTADRPAPASVKVFSLLATRTVRPGFPNTIGRFAAHAVVANTDSSSLAAVAARVMKEGRSGPVLLG